MAISSSVSQSFRIGRKALKPTETVLGAVRYYVIFFVIALTSASNSSLVMKGLDVINVSEYDVLLAADFRRCISALCVLQVMGCKVINFLYKFRFPIYQVLDQLAGGIKSWFVMVLYL